MRYSIVLAFAALSACSSLNKYVGKGVPDPKPPTLSVAAVRLANAPSNRDVAGALCTKYVSPTLCSVVGHATDVSQLSFVFDIELNVTNPNEFMLPLAELLTAFTAFPEQTDAQALGAVCLKLCPEGQTCPTSAPEGCKSDRPEIKSMSDFAQAGAGFLLGMATGANSVDNLRIRTLPAGASTPVVVRFELNAEQVLSLLGGAGSSALAQIKQGKTPKFEIPFRAEGTAWVDVQGFGRLAAPFGPFSDRWSLL